MIKCKCGYCGNGIEKQTGHYNRAIKLGLKVYCDRKCFGLGKRIEKSSEQKKKEKAEYDKTYRATSPTLKKRKADFHKKTYNPQRQKEINRQRYPSHLEYLRQPKYRDYKKRYDQKYRTNKLYGEFAEAAIILAELERLLPSKQIKYDNGVTIKKQSQKRKRKWQHLQNSKTSMQRI